MNILRRFVRWFLACIHKEQERKALKAIDDQFLELIKMTSSKDCYKLSDFEK